MKTFKLTLLSTILFFTFSCKKNETEQNNPNANTEQITFQNKIVTLNGGITETVSALGAESQIVGTDVTSTFPESLKTTAKDLGHVRTMTIEPIMSLNPTLILATDKDLNPELMKKIKESGIKSEIISQEFSIDGTKKMIEDVAKIIGNNDYQKLINKINEDVAKIQPIAPKPKVLFIYARGNNLMVSGSGTAMAKMIEIAGGQNAITKFQDFKPLTPEALVQSNPDVLLFFSSGLQGAGGIDGILKMPGVAQTNAGKNKKIIAMDGGLLSSFGPRVGEAAVALNLLLIENTK